MMRPQRERQLGPAYTRSGEKRTEGERDGEIGPIEYETRSWEGSVEVGKLTNVAKKEGRDWKNPVLNSKVL